MSDVHQDDGDATPVPVDPDASGPRRLEPDVLAAIAAGGALGAPARYGLAQLIHAPPGTFPWSTFWTNVSGSFVLGLLLVVVIRRFPPGRYVRAFVATGFLGAFTTFSTFAVEVDLLARDGHASLGILYALASLLTGLTGAWAGIVLGRAVPVGRSTP